MSARLVIACYRPKEGRAEALEALVLSHVERLRAEGLVTDRAPIVGRASDGTLVEMFEWASDEAIERAHDNAAVRTMWGEFEEVCHHVRLADLPEATELFAGLTPV